jgi:hypothetical protein
MLQILIRWDKDKPEDNAMHERLVKGFDKMGCWRVELPPKESIYKTLLTLETEDKEDKDGKKD